MANTSMILLIGGGMGLLLLVVGILVSVFGSRSMLEERLGQYNEAGVAVAAPEAKARTTPLADALNRMGEGTNLFDGISKNLARADIKLRPAEYIVVEAGVAAGGAVVGLIVGRSILIGVLLGIVGFFLPGMYVGSTQRRRLVMFDNQLGDMLNLMVNGLRAGYSTLQAMEAVSRELPSPISVEFHRVVQEMQLGISMEDSLDHLMRRISSDDLDLVVTAINVQREVGGNLAEILDVISFTIRERVRIKGEINALTSQGRATAWVISALPLALMAILYLVNRSYFMEFLNPATRGCGIPMLMLGGGMIAAGFAIVQKMVKIDI